MPDITLTQDALKRLISNSQPLACHAPGKTDAVGTIQIYGLAALENGSNGGINTTASGLYWHAITRNNSAGATAVRQSRTFGVAVPFHALLDPATVAAPTTIVFEDFCQIYNWAGLSQGAFGFHEHITQIDPTTLVGIGFKYGTDNVWHGFVHDSPVNALPVTVRRDTTFTGILATAPHRLTLVIDGYTKTIIWLIDRVEVDRWTPPTFLNQMGTLQPHMMYSQSVAAYGNAHFRMHAGGIPQLRMFIRKLT